MSRLLVALSLVATCGCGAAKVPTAEAETAAAPSSTGEDSLAIRVQQALMATPTLDAASITVHAEGGAVYLMGRVQSPRDIAEARRIAEGVPGVTRAYTNALRAG